MGSFEGRHRLQTCLAALAATLSAAAGASPASEATAIADEPQSQASPGLEEVIVSARRREENAQNVPLAITSFTPEILQQQDLRTVTDLERSIPGLNLCCGRGRMDFVWLRGIPGVVGYFSEVPVNLDGAGLLFDLSGVSALKGPQGTLFGLSTNGGALLYTPAAPTEHFEGYAQNTLGNYGRQTTEGVLNVPLMDGALLVRMGAQVSHTDGYVRDLTQHKDLNDENYWVGRLSVTARPTERFENSFVLNVYDFHNNGSTNVLTDLNPNGLAQLIYGADTIEALYEQTRALGVYAIPGSSIPGGTSSEGRQLNLIDTATWTLSDDLTLKNIYSYQRVSRLDVIDGDTLPLPIFDYGSSLSRRGRPNTQHTEELQLQGTAFEQNLTYTLGTFNAWRESDPGTPSYMEILSTLSGSQQNTSARTNALFAQGTYDLSALLPGLSITAGYRYSWDKRTLQTRALNAAGQIVAQFYGEGEWSAPSYTLGLQYELGPRTMIFITNSKGYSSGGFNLGNYIPSQFASFEPESLNNFEAGIKTDWSAGNVEGRLNLTAFYGIYEDIQTYLVMPGTADAPPPGTVLVQLNAAKGHIDGIDAELTVMPWPSLQLYGNATVIDAKYDRYMANGADLSSRDFVFVPELKYGVGLRYQLPLDLSYGEVSFTADYTRQSKVNGNANKDVPIPQDYRPAFENLNLGLNWNAIAGVPAFSGGLFVSNVTQNHFGAGGSTGYDIVGIRDLQVVPPRMWSVRLRYSF